MGKVDGSLVSLSTWPCQIPSSFDSSLGKLLRVMQGSANYSEFVADRQLPGRIGWNLTGGYGWKEDSSRKKEEATMKTIVAVVRSKAEGLRGGLGCPCISG